MLEHQHPGAVINHLQIASQKSCKVGVGQGFLHIITIMMWPLIYAAVVFALLQSGCTGHASLRSAAQPSLKPMQSYQSPASISITPKRSMCSNCTVQHECTTKQCVKKLCVNHAHQVKACKKRFAKENGQKYKTSKSKKERKRKHYRKSRKGLITHKSCQPCNATNICTKGMCIQSMCATDMNARRRCNRGRARGIPMSSFPPPEEHGAKRCASCNGSNSCHERLDCVDGMCAADAMDRTQCEWRRDKHGRDRGRNWRMGPHKMKPECSACQSNNDCAANSCVQGWCAVNGNVSKCLMGMSDRIQNQKVSMPPHRNSKAQPEQPIAAEVEDENADKEEEFEIEDIADRYVVDYDSTPENVKDQAFDEYETLHGETVH